MGYIYVITNKINQKLYVGKCTSTIEKRWKEHCVDYKRDRCNKRPLYNAMIKYGVDNFTILELEYVEDEEHLLSERESYWINKLNTYGHTGYNATKGGDGIMLYNYEEILSLYSLLKSVEDVCRIVHCDRNTVTKLLNKYNIKREERIAKAKPKAVKLYSLNNELLNIFESALQAGKYLKAILVTTSSGMKIGRNISRCASGERKTAYGYIWKYKG